MLSNLNGKHNLFLSQKKIAYLFNPIANHLKNLPDFGIHMGI